MGVSFSVGSCVQSEWVLGEGGLYEFFWEQGPPVGVQMCLERFHRQCIDKHGNCDSTNAVSVLATAGSTSFQTQHIETKLD